MTWESYVVIGFVLYWLHGVVAEVQHDLAFRGPRAALAAVVVYGLAPFVWPIMVLLTAWVVGWEIYQRRRARR